MRPSRQLDVELHHLHPERSQLIVQAVAPGFLLALPLFESLPHRALAFEQAAQLQVVVASAAECGEATLEARLLFGIEFSAHMLRHSRATELIRGGVPIEIVSKLLTHRSVTTTSDAYVHLDVEDLRAELVRAGAWEGERC